VSRFKTGTPPRVDGRTVDWSRVERQDGDGTAYRSPSMITPSCRRQLPCWITWAGEEVKEIIRRASRGIGPVWRGRSAGGGRATVHPSKTKIVKVPPTPKRHQVFLEPEGLDTHELYVNGCPLPCPSPCSSSSYAPVPGLERATMTRPGYADRVRLLSPHPAHAVARDEGGRAPVLRRANQRNDWLRGKRPAKVSWPGSTPCADPWGGARDPGAGRCLQSASLWTTSWDPWRGRAVSAVHVRDPSSGCCCGRTTRCGGWRRSLSASGLLTVAERRVAARRFEEEEELLRVARANGRSPRAPLPPRSRTRARVWASPSGSRAWPGARASRYARCSRRAGVMVTAEDAAVVERRDRAEVRWISRARAGGKRHGWPSSRRLRCRQNLPYLEFHSLANRSAGRSSIGFDRRPSLRRRAFPACRRATCITS